MHARVHNREKPRCHMSLRNGDAPVAYWGLKLHIMQTRRSGGPKFHVPFSEARMTEAQCAMRVPKFIRKVAAAAPGATSTMLICHTENGVNVSSKDDDIVTPGWLNCKKSTQGNLSRGKSQFVTSRSPHVRTNCIVLNGINTRANIA